MTAGIKRQANCGQKVTALSTYHSSPLNLDH